MKEKMRPKDDHSGTVAVRVHTLPLTLAYEASADDRIGKLLKYNLTQRFVRGFAFALSFPSRLQ